MQPTTTAGTIVRERPSASRRRPVSAPHLWGIPAISPHAALADGEFVLAPSSPKVYLISGGVRRWVPDPTTYLALAPNGWASLVQVTDAQMASVTEGPAIPSREDGRVYRGADGPDVYVIQSLARHHIPDGQTLDAEFGGWGAVVTIAQTDWDAISLGADIPSVTTADTSVDAYLRSLPDLHVDPVHEEHDPIANSTYDAPNGLTYDVQNEHASLTTQQDYPWLLSPVLDVLYPGALLQGASLSSGQLAPVAGGLERAGGTITLATDIRSNGGPPPTTASSTVTTADFPHVQDARQQLIRQLAPDGGAADIDYDQHEARTTEHGLVKLGVSFSSGSFSGNIKASLDEGLTQTTAMVMFRQVFYSVTFTPPDGDDPFFADAVTVDQVKAVCTPDNPACYLSQIDYGRILLVCITGTDSFQQMTASLEAGLSSAASAGPSGSIQVSADQEQTLHDSEVRVVALGGNGMTALEILDDPITELPRYLNDGGNFTADNPGVPIRYVARHAGSRNVVTINQTTDYDEAVAILGRNVNGASFQVWDGPGGGPVNTQIRVANGDHLSVSATGLNQSGVIFTGTYGPDGWSTWSKPSGGGYPLPNNHPFGLRAPGTAGPRPPTTTGSGSAPVSTSTSSTPTMPPVAFCISAPTTTTLTTVTPSTTSR
jgi:Thiol-activated cytolysin